MDHPVYTAAVARGPNSDGRRYWIGLADTARLIRSALADAFPGVRFYVRSSSYSGGSSINVNFDGAAAGAPSSRDVDAVVSGYASRRFDGMIDMAYNVDSWLNPDGVGYVAHNPGTVGSMGVDPGYVADPSIGSAILVSFGAGYVFVNDYLPYDVRTKAAA